MVHQTNHVLDAQPVQGSRNRIDLSLGGRSAPAGDNDASINWAAASRKSRAVGSLRLAAGLETCPDLAPLSSPQLEVPRTGPSDLDGTEIQMLAAIAALAIINIWSLSTRLEGSFDPGGITSLPAKSTSC
jgi:hypothetical protein